MERWHDLLPADLRLAVVKSGHGRDKNKFLSELPAALR
jgi:hypothetical protein